jgi:hypothetical protein
MDFTQLSLGLSGATLVALVGFLVKGSMRLGALEVKVETMWAFQMRRAVSETITTGLGQLNSPLHFTDAAIAALEPMRQQLLEFWKSVPPGTTDGEALLLIEARFGDEILKYVCIPCSLSNGACLLLALTIAKQSNEISFVPVPLGLMSGVGAWWRRLFLRWRR